MTAECAHERVIPTTDVYAQSTTEQRYARRGTKWNRMEQRGWCQDCRTRVIRVSPIVELGAWGRPRDPETVLQRPACD